ncbi:MAG: TolB family protein [Fimbriimonadales bacterium]
MNRIQRRERLLIGILIVLIMIGALALIRSQPWGRVDLRPLKPNTPNWIVCVRLNDDAHGDIVMLLPDGQMQMLTEDDFDDRSPDWAPDGKKLVFSSNRRDYVYQLWTIDPDGRGLSQLTLGGGAKLAPYYDRDGRYILHIAQGLVTEVDVKGVHSLQLIPSASQMVQVREQYGQIAFRYAKRPNPDLIAAVQRIDEGEQVVLQDLRRTSQQFTLPVVIAGEQVDLDWAPRGQSLVVGGAGLVVPTAEGELRVGGVIRFDFGENPGEIKPLPLWLSRDNSQAAIELVWSPDGSRVAFVLCERRRDGALQRVGLATVPEIGGAPTVIVEGEVYHPHWSPDGQQLVFAMGKPGNRQIYTVRIDGTELTQRTQSGDYLTPKWSPAR